jgi:excisionase family DNA binding protein
MKKPKAKKPIKRREEELSEELTKAATERKPEQKPEKDPTKDPKERPPPLLLTLDEAAYMLRVSRRTVDNLVTQGVLEKVKVRLVARITRKSVLALCGERATEAAE